MARGDNPGLFVLWPFSLVAVDVGMDVCVDVDVCFVVLFLNSIACANLVIDKEAFNWLHLVVVCFLGFLVEHAA
jgi:hypothetical protein